MPNKGHIMAQLATRDLFFVIAGRRVHLRSNDPAFCERFTQLYLDCSTSQVEQVDSRAPDQLLVVNRGGGEWIDVEISGHCDEQLETALIQHYPEMAFRRLPALAADGWSYYAAGSASSDPVLMARGQHIRVAPSLPWQRIVAHYFVNHTMRLSEEFFYFHAATLQVHTKGVLITGPKGGGKSTLSLALADRGHTFLGDEIAQVHGSSGLMVPFLRAVSIRPGPQTGAVRRFLDEGNLIWDTMPDGTRRIRVPASRLFELRLPGDLRLSHAFFIGKHDTTPSAERFDFTWRDLGSIAPLCNPMRMGSSARRALQALQLFSGACCFRLTPGGSPEDTAKLMESLVTQNDI